MKRSTFLILVLLTLLVGATFGVIIVSAMRARTESSAPTSTAGSPTEISPSKPAERASVTASLSPTEENTPTATASPSPTAITLTPESSRTPSPTVDPGATPTITSTPDVDVCAQMDVSFIQATSSIVLFRLRNNNAISTTITRMALDWPEENDAVFNAILDGSVIWADVEMNSPTEMSSWRGEPSARSVLGTHALEFFFGTPAAQRGYSLEISFSNGCTISTSN